MIEGARFRGGAIIPLNPDETFGSRLLDEKIDRMLDGDTSGGIDLSRKAFKNLYRRNKIDYLPIADEMAPTWEGVRLYVADTVYKRPPPL